MRTCILTANLGGFDRVQSPVKQTLQYDMHCFTDQDFAPIAGLTPRLQYRLPKTHGWQMKPGYDLYVWLDGSITLSRADSLRWLIEQLGSNDIAFFRHPNRNTVREEVDYLEARRDHPYIKSRYENGLHKEQLAEFDDGYEDDALYASTAFVYRDTTAVREMMKEWLYTSARYFTCDQVALPYLLWKHNIRVNKIDKDVFKNPYLAVVSRHK